MLTNGEIHVLGLRAFHDHAQLDSQVTILSSEWKKQVADIGAGRSFTFQELANSAIQELVAAGMDMSILAGRMIRLVQMLGIDAMKPLGAQSDGMMRRVQIALKLLRPARVLLVDEVTADLDVLARQALLSFLREESEAGCAVVYCTHILDGLDQWATHLLHLRPGGHPGELLPQADMPGTVSIFQAVLDLLLQDAKLEPKPIRAALRVAGNGAELPSGWQNRQATHAGAYGSYSWNADTGSEDTWSFASVAPKPPSMPQAMTGGPDAPPGQVPGGFVRLDQGVGLGGYGAACPPLVPSPCGAAGVAAGARGPAAVENPFGAGPRGNTLPLEALVARGSVQPERP